MGDEHSPEVEQPKKRGKGRPRNKNLGITPSKCFKTLSLPAVPDITTELSPSKSITAIWRRKNKKDKRLHCERNHNFKSFVNLCTAIPIEIWENCRVDLRNSCGFCGLLVDDVVVLKNHIQKHLLLKCSLCSSIFDLLDLSLFMVHMEKHSRVSALPGSSANLNDETNDRSYFQAPASKPVPMLVGNSPKSLHIDERIPKIRHQEVELITEHNSKSCDGFQEGEEPSQTCTGNSIGNIDNTKNHFLTPQINHPIPNLAPSMNSIVTWRKTPKNRIKAAFRNFIGNCKGFVTRYSALPVEIWESFRVDNRNSCGLCRLLVDDVVALKNHIQKHLLLKCLLCSSVFDLLDSTLFKVHMEQHSRVSALPGSSANLNDKTNDRSYFIQKKKTDKPHSPTEFNANIAEESVAVQSKCNKPVPMFEGNSPKNLHIDVRIPKIGHQEVELITEHNSKSSDGFQDGEEPSHSCTGNSIGNIDNTKNHFLTPQINHPIPNLAPSMNSIVTWRKTPENRIKAADPNFISNNKGLITRCSALPIKIWEDSRVDLRNSCGFCGLLVDDVVALKNHIQKHLLLKCLLCSSVFDLVDSSLFKVHMEQHSRVSALPGSSANLNDKTNDRSYFFQKKKTDKPHSPKEFNANIAEESVAVQSKCNKPVPMFEGNSPNDSMSHERSAIIEHQEVEFVTEHNSRSCDELQVVEEQSSSSCICQGCSCSEMDDLNRNIFDEEENAITNTDAKLSVSPYQLTSTDIIENQYLDTIICLGSPDSSISCTSVNTEHVSVPKSLDLKVDYPLNLHDDKSGTGSRFFGTVVSGNFADVVEIVQDSPKSKTMAPKRNTEEPGNICNADDAVCEKSLDEPSVKKRKSGNEPNSKDLNKINSFEINAPTTKRVTGHSVSSHEKMGPSEITLTKRIENCKEARSRDMEYQVLSNENQKITLSDTRTPISPLTCRSINNPTDSSQIKSDYHIRKGSEVLNENHSPSSSFSHSPSQRSTQTSHPLQRHRYSSSSSVLSDTSTGSSCISLTPNFSSFDEFDSQ